MQGGQVWGDVVPAVANRSKNGVCLKTMIESTFFGRRTFVPFLPSVSEPWSVGSFFLSSLYDAAVAECRPAWLCLHRCSPRAEG